MAEDDWGDFEGSEPGPKAFAAAPVAAHSRPLPADLFSNPEVAGDADEFGGFAAAGTSSPPSAHQQALGAAAAPSFSKSQAVSYFDGRSGSWVPAKVVHVDLTVHPPSYGVELPGGGFRETEAARLRPLGEAPVSAKVASGSAGTPPAHAVNGHAGLKQPAAMTPAAAAVPALAAQEDNDDDVFGDFFAAPPSPPAATSALRVPTPAAVAVPAAVGSPPPSLLGAAAGSPQSRGSGPPSPAVRSFRTFLHAAAADVADEMDAEDAAAGAGAFQQRQQAAAPAAASAASPPAAPVGSMPSVPVAAGVHRQQQVEPADDDFGDFSAAAAPLAVLQPPVAAAAPATKSVPSTPSAAAAAAPAPQAAAAAPQPAAAIPYGVRRDAPLPLDLFGEEPEDVEPAMANGHDQPVAAAAIGAAAAAAAGPVSPQPPPQVWQASAAVPAAPAGTPAAAASSWDGDEDFADFQGSEAPLQEGEQGQHQIQQPAAAAHQAAAWDDQVQAAAQPDSPAQRLPSTFTDRHGRVLAVDYPDRFVRQPPQAASARETTVEVSASMNDQPGGAAADDWAENGDGFADFAAAANGAADRAVEALSQHAATLAAPPPPPAGPHSPSTLSDRAGSVLAVDHADLFMRPPPHSVAVAGQQPPAAAAGMPASTAGALAATACDAPLERAGEEGGEPTDSCSAPPGRHVQQHAEQAAGFAAFAAAPDAAARAEQQEAPRDALQERHQQQQQEEQAPPASPGSGRRASAVLTALHPVSPQGSSGAGSIPLRPGGQLGSWPVAGYALGPAAGSTNAAAAGAEVVTEYAIAWSRLLQAAAQQLRDSASLWVEAGRQGCWHELAALPAAQQHLAACAQLYAAAAVVRLAAQQLGLLSLVPELQEDWARVEAAWATPPAQPAAVTEDAAEDAAKGDQQGDAQQQQQQGDAQQQQPAAAAEGAPGCEAADLPEAACTAATQQPPFQEAALAAAAACGLAERGGAGSGAPALPLLAAAQGAPALLADMSLDDFPRLLTWSDGLCGLTLLPLSLFEGRAPVAPWLDGRPCLVPLANLWRHRVSAAPPQLD